MVSDLSFYNETIEICTVKVVLSNCTKFILGIYRPHSDSVENFNHVISNILNNRILANKSLFIAGDLNINILNDNSISNSFINNLNSYHFIPLITKPTRFSTTALNPSLLDHIWTNELTQLTCGVILTDVTDHCMTFLRYPVTEETDDSRKTRI